MHGGTFVPVLFSSPLAQSHPLEGGQKLPILDEAACPFCKIFKGEIGRNVIVAKVSGCDAETSTESALTLP